MKPPLPRVRDLAKVAGAPPVPDPLNPLRRSWEAFAQPDTPPDERRDAGLQAAFRSTFPADLQESATLEFLRYELGEPTAELDECRRRCWTYAAPLTVELRLALWERDDETGRRTCAAARDQRIPFGHLPLMTPRGTFIVHGVERVVFGRLERAPGVFFQQERHHKDPVAGKLLFSCHFRPHRGAGLSLSFDAKDRILARIGPGKGKAVFATVLLRALGYGAEDLLACCYDVEEVAPERAQGRVLARAVVAEGADEPLAPANQRVTQRVVHTLRGAGVDSVPVLRIDNETVGPFLSDTLEADGIAADPEWGLTSADVAAKTLFERLRTDDRRRATPDEGRALLEERLFGPGYDLSSLGRRRLEQRLGTSGGSALTKADLLEAVRQLIRLRTGDEGCTIDDENDLAHRRLRLVGDHLLDCARSGLHVVARDARERAAKSRRPLERLQPHHLVDGAPFIRAVHDLLKSEDLSEVVDRNNPLAELAQKRRVRVGDPSPHQRLEVRDVQPSQYGRLCPIDTPEGRRVGEVASLALYAHVGADGILESPCRRVAFGRVLDEPPRQYSAAEESGHVVAQADAVGGDGEALRDGPLPCRADGGFALLSAEDVSLVDVSPSQLLSWPASLIPFVGHDDASRALMGCNMQRQALPLVRPRPPLVRTGMEAPAGAQAGWTVVARRDGVVVAADARRILVAPDTGDVAWEPADVYRLEGFGPSAGKTCLHHRPRVRPGEHVPAGQVLADGPATAQGELALGRDVLVAFMPWRGYNFEDAIVVSERLVAEDVFTSIHVDELSCGVRKTRKGGGRGRKEERREEITRDLPGVAREDLEDLADDGVVRCGVALEPGDLAVGRVSPKEGEEETPEARLLRAIFGDLAGPTRDTSLRVPPGGGGVVVERVGLSRETRPECVAVSTWREQERARLAAERDEVLGVQQRLAYEHVRRLLVGEAVAEPVGDLGGPVHVHAGEDLSAADLARLPREAWPLLRPADPAVATAVAETMDRLREEEQRLEAEVGARLDRVDRADELPPGERDVVRVRVAGKRKLQVGDKMAGRHGNKGVVGRVLPVEDMPLLPDGTPVDMVLNPLGVPSRMNVGQLLETHLGWVGRRYGERLREALEGADTEGLPVVAQAAFGSAEVAERLGALDEDELRAWVASLGDGVAMRTPTFDGATGEEVLGLMEEVGLPVSGKVRLRDGRTGEPFQEESTVGVLHMMKLAHEADDKVHGRETGPYSLVTQQPVGGQARRGGQRLGEMEVWALEAHGAVETLRECLTVKSDDPAGRHRLYGAVLKGKDRVRPALPESFAVLVAELRALGLDVQPVEPG